MPAKMGIYKITNTRTGKVYVGSSIDIAVRIRKHMKMLSENRHHSLKLQQSYLKWGAVSFKHEILEIVPALADLMMREQYWIDHYDAANAGYNINPIADSCRGRKQSAESNAKRSAALKGRKKPEGFGELVAQKRRGRPAHPNSIKAIVKSSTGRKWTDQQREKFIAGVKASWTDERKAAHAKRMRDQHTLSPEGRERIIAHNTGRHVSDESRRKMSDARNSPETQAKYRATRAKNIAAAAALVGTNLAFEF